MFGQKLNMAALEQQDKSVEVQVTLQGWVRNHRKQKTMGFLDFFDGSRFGSLQVVYSEEGCKQFPQVQEISVGAAIQVEGLAVVNPRGKWEIQASSVKQVGESGEKYPLQPKKHSLEFLREIAHLRPRTKLFQAMFRVRSAATLLIHSILQEEGYLCVHTPILTANDGEGAGSTFTVTTEEGEEAFFGKKASLAVTGQLEGEIFALAFGKAYTFGPAFRAENSNTKLHGAEFWMVEPEIAFCDLDELMDREEAFLKTLIAGIKEKAKEELNFMWQFTGQEEAWLDQQMDRPFLRLSYDKAVQLLRESGKTFDHPLEEGEDLAREHEKYLTDEVAQGPVFLYDWPEKIKPFYSKQVGSAARAVDLLVPRAGELMGGGEREGDLEKLEERMAHMGVSPQDLDWYLDLRRYGSCPHSGFGMGFDRFLLYLTGMDNIRDTAPFLRTPQNLRF